MKIKTTLAVFGAILALSACTQVSTDPAKPTTAPVEAEVYADNSNDGFMSQAEWSKAVAHLQDEGLDVSDAGVAVSEELGSSLCDLAVDAQTQDQFGEFLTIVYANSDSEAYFTEYEFGMLAGAFMSMMCSDELTRLGF